MYDDSSGETTQTSYFHISDLILIQYVISFQGNVVSKLRNNLLNGFIHSL